MNSSGELKDPGSLFRSVPIGLKQDRKQPLNIPKEQYNHYVKSEATEGRGRTNLPQNEDVYSLEQRMHAILKGRGETSTTEIKTEAGDNMDDSIKLLLERIERDSREREDRYHKDAKEREQRYREEMLEQDRRLRQEAKEREERILTAIKDNADRTEKNIEKVEAEIISIKSEVENSVKHSQSLVTTNIWGFVATVVAIIVLAVTVFLTVTPK